MPRNKVEQAHKTLLLPDGTHRRIQELDVIPLNRDELAALIGLDAFCRKFPVRLTCGTCEQSLVGLNSGHERYFAVACACREYRYERTRT